MTAIEQIKAAKQASPALLTLTDETRAGILNKLADSILAQKTDLLAANASDLAKMSPENPLYDRLMLTAERLEAIASDMRQVAALPTPVGEVLEHRTLPNGIDLQRVAVPFGVVGVIYEARPNVTFDVFSLCFKTGNACILKGGKDAENTNRAAIAIIRNVLENHGINPDVAVLLPSTHDAVADLLSARGDVDIVIPRGGRRLIDFVRDNARVPVIETGAGVVHIYVDATADPGIARDCILNAKLRRPSVCNSLDTVLFHRDFKEKDEILAALENEGVTLHFDEKDWDTEWMSKNIGVRVVGSIDEALEHIAAHGSGHSESIITADEDSARRFTQAVDASSVYVNLPTSFTDGGQFGLGAEVGISTQKLGPRGPMGLPALTTYKWILRGHGQTRP